MATQGKKVKEEKGPNPYDFSLKRQTRLDKEAANMKPIPAPKMAEGMLRAHGYEGEKRIVTPLTTASFKDKDGNPVVANPSSKYWTTVLQLLNKAVKSA